MTMWFTSDLHFGHEHLLQYQRKEFPNAAAMDRVLIAKWQELVKPKDQIYILGDLSFRRPIETVAILDQLPGRKVLVRGNHDRNVDKPALRKYFERIEDLLEIKIPDKDAHEGHQRLVLCHYPMVTWNASRYGSWMLHGHCHGNLREDLLPKARRLDVGVDCTGYVPISYERVKELMKLKSMDVVDHHKPPREGEGSY